MSISVPNPPVLARPQDLPVVAEVNGVAIYPEQLVWMYAIDATLAQWVGAAPPRADALLDRAIHTELVSQAARQSGYIFPEETLTSTLAAFLLNNGHTRDELERVLADQGISQDVFLGYYRRLLLVDAFSRQQADLAGQDVATYVANLRRDATIATFSQNLPDLPAPVLSSPTVSPEIVPTSTPLPPTPSAAATTTPTATPLPDPTPLTAQDRGPYVGAFAPDFSLSTLEGGTLSWQDLVGTPTVLSFWVTWCSHCQAQTPRLIDAYMKYADEDVRFAGISVSEARETVQAYVDAQRIPYSIALDSDGVVGAQYGVNGFPTTVFLDRDGRIVAVHVGELSAADLDRYIGQISSITGE